MQLLHGRYEILEIIKSGGMGAVYEARDSKLADSPCAVKEILEDKQNEIYFQTRFEQEMKMLAELDHPAIPRVRDFFRLRGKHYLVMDLVRGQSLFDELVEKEAPLSPEQVASDMLELLDVLDYLHGHSPPMIHRDIKPSNILRDRRGQIKLVDFGLARAACGATQTAVGTLGFCAPEQSVGRADPRSDLYSVGATMLQLLTGYDPDLLNPNQQLQKVPPGLRQIIQRATRLKAQERYASAKEMATDLKLYQKGLGAAAGRTAEPETAEPHVIYVASPATPWRGYATAAAIVLALGLGTLLGRSEASPPAQAPAPAAPRPMAQQPTPPQFTATQSVAAPSAAPTQMANYIPPRPQPVAPPEKPAPTRPAPPPAEIRPSLGASSYPTYHGPEPAAQPTSEPPPSIEVTEEEVPQAESQVPRQPPPWRDRLGLPGRRWRQLAN